MHESITLTKFHRLILVSLIFTFVASIGSPSGILVIAGSVFFLFYAQIWRQGKLNFNSTWIYLGTICFGIYLLHPSILISVAKLGLTNHFQIALVSFFYSAIASSFLHLFIERPGVYLGRLIVSKVEKRNIIIS